MLSIGIDLGATRIKAGVVAPDGRVVARRTRPTAAHEGVDTLIDRLVAIVDALDPKRRVPRVGIGFAGMVDADAGRILTTTDTMPALVDFALADRVADATGRQVRIDNDGNVAAIAEARFGGGRRADVRSLAMFTLGTGVGGGVVVDGRIWRGAGHMAGKLGHIKVRRGGRRCACGARGCLEAYASAYALRRATGRDAAEVFRAARDGDGRARRLIDEMADALGVAMADVAHVLNPERIVVGGGIASSWRQLEAGTRAAFERNVMPHAARSTTIGKAKLGASAGVVGAALLFAKG